MIESTVRKRFRRVYFRAPESLPPGPIIFAANHHGWHDGYLMFHLVRAVERPALDWITEFDGFPLFGHAGGMPFPADDPARRAATIRQTIRRMNDEGRSLILFPEVHLHPPPEILPLGKAVETLMRKVSNAALMPVAIHYQMDLHERPEAYLAIGDRIQVGEDLLGRLQSGMEQALDSLRARVASDGEFDVLVQGTMDVNERWDFRARFGKK